MMKLGLMKLIVDTLMGENGQSYLADEFAVRWLDQGAQASHLRSSANTVFKVHTDKDLYYLRFNHSSEREIAYIDAELKYIEHLASAGLRVARPIRSLSGHLVETLSTDIGIFYGVLFESCSGDEWAFDSLDINAFEIWGRTLAMSHVAGQDYNISGRPTWSDHIQYARHWIPQSDRAAFKELQYMEQYLNARIINNDTYGLIHFDFEPDNLLWNKTEATILDWDDCAYYWYEADIAFALRDLFEDQITQIDFEDDRLRAFLKGYRSIKFLDDAAVKQLPLFLRLHNLISLARMTRSIEEGPLKGEQEWTTNLREKIKVILEQRRLDLQTTPLRTFSG